MEFLLLFTVFAPLMLAFAVYFLGRRHVRRLNALTIAACALELLAAAVIFAAALRGESCTVWIANICGFGLSFEAGGFRALYLLVTAFAWFVSAVFTADYMKKGENRARYAFFLLLTLCGTVGVFLSADLYTTFLFFEMMSFASYPWVAHEETGDAREAAQTYLAIAVIGGLTALMGIWLLQNVTGTLVIRELSAAVSAASSDGKLLAAAICLFIGFGAKAGLFPLHIWLPKAHAAAPATASSLLSGILTKGGVFGLIILSCEIMFGNEAWGVMTLCVAVLTMVIGGVLALLDNNIKRTLACSSVSQIGFILTGCAILTLEPASGLAAGGVVLHMLNHSLCKLVLFTAAGIAYMNTHTLDLEKLRGWGRGKPLFFLCFLLGAWGITGIPGGSGYISKTLLHEALAEYAAVSALPGFFTACEWLFLLSGGLTLAYMTKLFVVLFLEKSERKTQKKPYMNRATAVVLMVTALLIPILGLLPGFTANRLAALSMPFFNLQAFEGAAYFSWESLQGSAISILAGLAVYFLIIRTLAMRKNGAQRVYVNARPAWLDMEHCLYRPLLLFLTIAGGILARIADSLLDALLALLRATFYRDMTRKLPPEYGNRVTYALGSAMDRVADSYCAITNRKRRKKPYIYRLSKSYEILTGENRIITRSMGYAMMMTCIGIFVTLIYIFVKLF